MGLSKLIQIQASLAPVRSTFISTHNSDRGVEGQRTSNLSAKKSTTRLAHSHEKHRSSKASLSRSMIATILVIVEDEQADDNNGIIKTQFAKTLCKMDIKSSQTGWNTNFNP